MSEYYLGEIRRVAFDFAPRGWARCDGQILSIATNQALFSLLGTYYGGNGVTTFGLPDLRGRSPIHPDSQRGLPLAVQGGSRAVTLLPTSIPAHTHQVQGTSATASASSPAGAYFAATAQPTYGTDVAGQMAVDAVGSTGSTLPHDNESPYLVLNYIIALNGIYPSRG